MWAVFGCAYQFGKCKKCAAPSLFIDEYWTKTTEPEEFQNFMRLIKSTGSAKGFEVQRLRYAAFHDSPFPQWTHDLEQTEMVLFWEIYSAISVRLLSLAMMGIRTLVDRYANRTVGDIGGFERKLEQMRKDGYINVTQLDHLRAVVHAGHAASHWGVQYEKVHVLTALEIVESLLLHERYGKAVDGLRSATPARVAP